jgi:hypothetical protein
MFLAHSFRLRDPWQCEATADGGLRWSRVFHRPTGLEPDDQLVLVLTGAPPATQVTINGHQFELRGRESFATSDVATMDAPQSQKTPDPFQFDLTSLLADANRIELLIPPQASSLKPQASSPFPYDARLAIIGHS